MNCSRTIRQVVGVRNSTRSSINIRVEDFVCRRIYVHILYERCDLFLFVLFFWKGPSLNKKPCGFFLAGRFSSGFHQTPSTLPAPLHCCSLLLLLLLKVIKEKKSEVLVLQPYNKKKELLQGLCRRRSRTVNSTWGVAGSVQLLVPFGAV